MYLNSKNSLTFLFSSQRRLCAQIRPIFQPVLQNTQSIRKILKNAPVKEKAIIADSSRCKNENPANNELDNLAVVCTEHHDEIHKKGGVTKRFSKELIKKFKHEWEAYIINERTKNKSPLESESGIESILFQFEIRKKLYDIQAIEDSNTSAIKRNLDFLHTLYLLEGISTYSKTILEGFDRSVILSALGDINKAAMIAEEVHTYFYHLPGPEHVDIDDDDVENLEIAIGILDTIGHFSCEFNRHPFIVEKLAVSCERLYDIIAWYKQRTLAIKFIKMLDRTIDACLVIEEDEEESFEDGLSILRDLIGYCLLVTVDEQPRWNKVKEEFGKIQAKAAYKK